VPGRAEGDGSTVRACGRTAKMRLPTWLTGYTLAPSPAAAPSLALILLKLQDSMAERSKAHRWELGLSASVLSTERTSSLSGARTGPTRLRVSIMAQFKTILCRST